MDLATEPSGTTSDETDGKLQDVPVITEIPGTAVQEEVPVKKSKEEKVHAFSKLFKKKSHPKADSKSAGKEEKPSESQTDVSPPAADPQPVS